MDIYQSYLKVMELYNELIYSVESKFPGESRHETALRYIKEAEAKTSEPVEVKEVPNEAT